MINDILMNNILSCLSYLFVHVLAVLALHTVWNEGLELLHYCVHPNTLKPQLTLDLYSVSYLKLFCKHS